MSHGNDLLHFLRTAGLGRPAEADTDGQLLDRFVQRRDEGAFHALVGRHGPMVWAACRRALADSTKSWTTLTTALNQLLDGRSAKNGR